MLKVIQFHNKGSKIKKISHNIGKKNKDTEIRKMILKGRSKTFQGIYNNEYKVEQVQHTNSKAIIKEDIEENYIN